MDHIGAFLSRWRLGMLYADPAISEVTPLNASWSSGSFQKHAPRRVVDVLHESVNIATPLAWQAIGRLLLGCFLATIFS
jgi:hypothetical protein